MNKRSMIILLILLLAIGFAAVSTTLFINGSLLFGTKEDDFEVIFIKAIVDDVNLSHSAISEDGKTITYETKELATIGDESILAFAVRNNSTQYDAEIEMNCIGGASVGIYYELTYDLPTFVEAQKEVDGNVTVKMIKNSLEEITEELTCTLNVTAAERTELAERLNCATNIYAKGTILNKMLGDNCVYADNIASTYVTSSNGISFGYLSSDTNGKGLYYTTDLTRTEDIDGDGVGEQVYYYRGNVENNYLIFANICWRIVRTNENNSVKLLYAGDVQTDGSCLATGATVSIGTTVFNPAYTDIGYVGYMYPDVPTTTSMLNMSNDTINKNESTAKKILDQWYDANLLDYSEYISDAIYCADRTVATGNRYYNVTNTKLAYGQNRTHLGGIGRFYVANSTLAWIPLTDPKPIYSCPRLQDSFTVSSILGNGKLTRPIGLITVDEISYAGGRTYASDGSSYSTNNYLYSKNWYFTMTPSGILNMNSTLGAQVMVFSTHFGNNLVTVQHTLRPSISIYSNVLISSGDGTNTNPYIVDTTNGVE